MADLSAPLGPPVFAAGRRWSGDAFGAVIGYQLACGPPADTRTHQPDEAAAVDWFDTAGVGGE